MTTKIISVAIQKGGVGKTTTAICVAHGLARLGKKVMIIDFDTQGQSASYMGLNQEPGVYNWLSFPLINTTKMTVDHVRQWVRLTNRDNLVILPGNSATAHIPNMVATDGRYDIKKHFKLCLAPLLNAGLDYIVFDTPPSKGPVQEGAVWAGDLILVPTHTEYGSLQGVNALTKLMRGLLKEGWKGKLAGILPTFFQGNVVVGKDGKPDVESGTSVGREQYLDLVKHFGESLILPPIHRTVAFCEAASLGKTIFEMDGQNALVKRAQDEYNFVVKHLTKIG